MSNVDIFRAWKDEDYRNSLTTAQLALLPKNPVGMIELVDEELEFVAGGKASAKGGCASCSAQCALGIR